MDNQIISMLEELIENAIKEREDSKKEWQILNDKLNSVIEELKK